MAGALFPADPSNIHSSDAVAEDEAWLDRLDNHAAEHGFHAQLGDRHGAVYTEEDVETLLVTFEEAGAMRDNSEAQLPFGLSISGREDWSQLCLYSEGDTWFRDDEVFSFFDDLVDDGFFDKFDRVLFFGAGAAGYAACAFSVAAPGARVFAIRPQATLDPAMAGWDHRYTHMRRTDFGARYGFGPQMIDAADHVQILFDPKISEDAMHATLYAGAGAELLRCPMVGRRTEDELAGMGLLTPLIQSAGKGNLSPKRFASLWRQRRRQSPAYLRHVLNRLESDERTLFAGIWARGALAATDRPRFRQALEAAEASLRAEGKALPQARTSED